MNSQGFYINSNYILKETQTVLDTSTTFPHIVLTTMNHHSNIPSPDEKVRKDPKPYNDITHCAKFLSINRKDSKGDQSGEISLKEGNRPDESQSTSFKKYD